MKGSISINIIVYIIIGIVVLAGLVFGITSAIKYLGKTDCSTGLGTCKEKTDEVLPLPATNAPAPSSVQITEINREVML